MIDHARDAEAIFLAALEKEAPKERTAFVEKACAGQPDLRRRLRELLEAHEESRGPLDAPPAGLGPATDLLAVTERPGTQIGPYKLLEQIGEGGMGLVFMAEQTQPVRRKVALKVLKPGMDTRQVVARFEAERQALALMDHPNIAKILDAGSTEPIADLRFQNADCRLQNADLKSEITNLKSAISVGRPYFVMELVRGVPITEFCDQHGLTTRQRLELFASVCRAVQHAHQKGIIHRDLKPSNVLVTLHDTAAVPKIIDFGIAKATSEPLIERTLFTHFAQMVGTPLYMSPEQAEMNSLDVDTRSDVYSLGVLLYELLTGTTPFESETLKKVGLDEMRRMIREDEPPRPSHRVSTLAAEASTTVSARRGVDGRQLGQVLRGELDWIVMRALEKDRNRRYESASAFAADVQRYLNDEAVAACPPSAGYRLRKYVRRNRRALVMAGVLAAALVTATAVSAWQAARATDAQHQAEADRRQAETDRKQAESDRDRAQTAEGKAKANLDRAKEAEKRAADEAAIARAVNTFLQEDLLKQANSEGGPGSKGNLTVREALRRASDKVGERFRDQPLVEAAIRTAIGEACLSVQEHRLAVEHLERAVALRKAERGPHHQETLHSLHLLAVAYFWTGPGRWRDAVVIDESLLEEATARLGPDHPEVLGHMEKLANSYGRMGEWKKAMRLLEQGIEKDAARRGPIEAGASGTAVGLALVYLHAGLPAEAAARLDEVRECRKKIGRDSFDAFLEHCRSVAYQHAGKLDEADQMLRVLDTHYRKRADSGGLFGVARNLEFLSVNLLLQHRYSEAEQVARETIALYEKLPGDLVDFSLPYVKSVLGGALLGQKKYVEAEPLLLQGYEGLKRTGGGQAAGWQFRLPEAGERVVRFYEETNQPEKAREWRERLQKDQSKK
jgi:serine/threonine protein kinase/tetratricopeptide (TPR) repeat protein